ncbi:MAG: putative manganese-dependent inorganic diphosphatase [Opitutales bacterium]
MPTPTYIFGHRNPDADSICAALAYADLKKMKGETECEAARCGNSNARIDVILDRFNMPLPPFIGNVTPRIRDIMVRDVVKINRNTTCAEALELIDRHDIRTLPVVGENNGMEGLISIFQLGEFFIPKLREPREMRRVHTSIQSIINSLKATVLHTQDENRVEELFVRVGAMDVRSFGKFSETESISPQKSIIVVGDRWDIQQRSTQIGVRLLVITGNLSVEADVLEMARERGVNLIVSPYDSATTAWIIRSASTIERLMETSYHHFGPEAILKDVRKKIASINVPAFMVIDEGGRLAGLFTKTDILKPIPTKIILVDHNELSQAVPGAADVNIIEIVDHHRLGNLHTQQPILFVNEPVGSTCTIIGDLYRQENLVPPPAVAGVMMGGIIADTLNLNSPTATPKDRFILKWLSEIAETDPAELADIIFSSGSVIMESSTDEVIRADFKIYEEFGLRFSVSQVEELGFGNFWQKSSEILQALDSLREKENLYFAALLVTDINSQNSLLVVKGDQDFIDCITYPEIEKNQIFDLHGIVSRKKQLIPFIISSLRSLNPDASIQRER